jgi:hypothetical protein
MSNLDVRIERLVIRLRGVPAEVARSATHDLGRELLRQLAHHVRCAGGRGTVEIGALHLEPVTAPGSGSPTQLRASVARTIAQAIAARLPEGHGG